MQCNMLGPALELSMVPAPKLFAHAATSYSSNAYSSNAKLPWRSASCCCGLSCAVPSPNIAPGPSPDL